MNSNSYTIASNSVGRTVKSVWLERVAVGIDLRLRPQVGVCVMSGLVCPMIPAASSMIGDVRELGKGFLKRETFVYQHRPLDK